MEEDEGQPLNDNDDLFPWENNNDNSNGGDDEVPPEDQEFYAPLPPRSRNRQSGVDQEVPLGQIIISSPATNLNNDRQVPEFRPRDVNLLETAVIVVLICLTLLICNRSEKSQEVIVPKLHQPVPQPFSWQQQQEEPQRKLEDSAEIPKLVNVHWNVFCLDSSTGKFKLRPTNRYRARTPFYQPTKSAHPGRRTCPPNARPAKFLHSASLPWGTYLRAKALLSNPQYSHLFDVP